MIKKILLIFLILIVVSFASLLLWRYIKYVNDPSPYKTFLLPRVEMSVIEITSLTLEKANLNASILIKNQLPFGFTADSFAYEFYINDVQIIKSRYEKSIHLNGGDSSWVKLPITVYPHDIDSVIKANESRNIDSVEYKMVAHFYTDIIFQKKFDVEVKRFLPLFHLPVIKVNEMDIDSLNFKRALIMVHASLTNKNVFDIKLKDYAFEIQIEDHEVLKGIIEGLTVLKAKNTTQLDIPLTLSFKEVRKTLFELLKKGSKVNYKLHLTLKLESDQNMMKNSNVVVESTGTVKSILKIVKEKKDEKKKNEKKDKEK
ncbi:MAG: LEA type 2 family protein [Bacteroidota bacterium]